MEKLLKDIADAIEAAAAKEGSISPDQIANEIAHAAYSANQWINMVGAGRPADVVLRDLEDYSEKAWGHIIEHKTQSYDANSKKNIGFDGLFSVQCDAIALPLIAAHIKDMGKPGAPEGQPDQRKPTTKAWALYYYYLNKAEAYPELETSGGKMEAIKAIAERHGIGQASFLQCFNAITRNRDKNPLRNPANLDAAIELLESREPRNEKALELAKAEKMRQTKA